MKFYYILILALFSMQLSAQNMQDIERKLSVAELNEDFKLLKTELEEKHPGLYLYTKKPTLDSIFLAIQNSLNVEMTPIDFYRKVNKLNSIIKDAHTCIISPKEYRTALTTKLKRFPFQLYTYENKSFILENYSGNDSIPIGAEILEINNQSMEELRKVISTGTKRDGYNTTSVTHKIDHYFSGVYAEMLGCPDSYIIKYKNHTGSLVTKTIQGLHFNETLENGLSKRIEEMKNSPTLSYEVVNNIMVVRLKSFIPEKIEGDSNKKYKKEFKNIFDIIHDQGIQRLIVDIRDNAGGWPEVGSEFLSYLISEKIISKKSDKSKINKIVNEQYYLPSDDLKHFKKQKFKKTTDGFYDLVGFRSIQKPKKNTFKGAVVVLINGGCGSQSGAFSGLMRENVKATFIGEETGANCKIMTAGNTITLVLQHSKVLVDIPLRLLEIDTAVENTGHGVIPDIILRPTLTEKINKEDVVLKKALEVQ